MTWGSLNKINQARKMINGLGDAQIAVPLKVLEVDIYVVSYIHV